MEFKRTKTIYEHPDHYISQELTGMVKSYEVLQPKSLGAMTDKQLKDYELFGDAANKIGDKVRKAFYHVSKPIRYYEPTYPRDELRGVLKRHRGSKEEFIASIDKDCDCSCPFTSNSINMVMQFAFVENELPLDIRQAAYDMLTYLTDKSCFIGKNPLTVASLLTWLATRCLRGQHYPKFVVTGMFHLKSPKTLNDLLKTIKQMLGAEWLEITYNLMHQSASKITGEEYKPYKRFPGLDD